MLMCVLVVLLPFRRLGGGRQSRSSTDSIRCGLFCYAFQSRLLLGRCAAARRAPLLLCSSSVEEGGGTGVFAVCDFEGVCRSRGSVFLFSRARVRMRVFSPFLFSSRQTRVYRHYGRPSLSRPLCLLRSPPSPPPSVSSTVGVGPSLPLSPLLARHPPSPCSPCAPPRVSLWSSLSMLFVCLSECVRLHTLVCTCCRARELEDAAASPPSFSRCMRRVVPDAICASRARANVDGGELWPPSPTDTTFVETLTRAVGMGTLRRWPAVAVARPDRRTHSRECTLMCTHGRTVGEGWWWRLSPLLTTATLLHSGSPACLMLGAARRSFRLLLFSSLKVPM